MKNLTILLVFILVGCGSGGGSDTPEPPPVNITQIKIALGEAIFFDENLSEPAGQSCASCHDPMISFSDPDVTRAAPVSEGVVTGMFGNRNAPTAAYASFIPEFQRDSVAKQYLGGQFVDGRASTLADQAKGPFLNPVEMANTSEQMVIDKIKSATYANMFKQVYGESSLDNTSTAYEQMAEAIAAFESTEVFSPFTSKFDAVLAGTAQFTTQEQAGLDLFDGRAKCSECHTIDNTNNQPMFTNFTYSNIGTPKNPDNPFYNTDANFIDVGLSANPNLTTSSALEKGKFRVSTLRNVELTAPYLHNGVFQTLEEVVSFYNTRDSEACWGAAGEIPFQNCWPEPEVIENMDLSNIGDIGLNADEEAAIVAFMLTLTDGFTP